MSYLKIHWKQMLFTLLAYTCWSVLAFIFLVAFQGRELTIEQFGGDRIYINFGHSIIKGALVYYVLIFVFLIPSLQTRNWKKASFQIIIFFALLSVYEYLWAFSIGTPTQAESGHLTVKTFFLTLIMLDVLCILVSIFVAVLLTSYKMQQHKALLEKQKLQAELAAVKYQINPHFLFNSLSFIYTKTYKQNPEAAHAVQLLSEIMSYALEDWGDQGTVPLNVEVEQMKKVIEMNQIRFSKKLPISFNEEINNCTTQIPVLTLITIIENAFKHGDLSDENNKMTIELKASASKINFYVCNKKKKSPKEPSKGIGLENVRQRLQQFYGVRHTFVTKEDENYYITEITINL